MHFTVPLLILIYKIIFLNLPFLLISQTTTMAPRSANLSESNLPSPPPPPVTSAISPEMLFILYFNGINIRTKLSTMATAESRRNPITSPVDFRNDILPSPWLSVTRACLYDIFHGSLIGEMTGTTVILKSHSTFKTDTTESELNFQVKLTRLNKGASRILWGGTGGTNNPRRRPKSTERPRAADIIFRVAP